MADPVETECQSDYQRCRSKCFDNLVEGLGEAGDDPRKQADAKDRYRQCLKLCNAARAICEAEPA
jgi:hypothetical protein